MPYKDKKINEAYHKRKSAEWYINNKQKKLDYNIEQYHKGKGKARKKAQHYNFRRPYCLLHLLEGEEISAINFHHTDYIFNTGFSVCRKHHKIVDKW